MQGVLDVYVYFSLYLQQSVVIWPGVLSVWIQE